MTSVLFIVLITTCVFGLVIAGMAVGVMLGRKEIRGSCGGLGNTDGSKGESACSLCSNPDAACKELKNRMEHQMSSAESE